MAQDKKLQVNTGKKNRLKKEVIGALRKQSIDLFRSENIKGEYIYRNFGENPSQYIPSYILMMYCIGVPFEQNGVPLCIVS